MAGSRTPGNGKKNKRTIYGKCKRPDRGPPSGDRETGAGAGAAPAHMKDTDTDTDTEIEMEMEMEIE